jgi:hypothetical protein
MGIVVGGNIKQTIVKDRGWTSTASDESNRWDTSTTKVFNVQILNTLHFRRVTGLEAPKPPIDAKTYADLGLPFFSMYEEPTDVSGNFRDVRSIGQINGRPDAPVRPHRLVKIRNRPSAFSFSSFLRSPAGSHSKENTKQKERAQAPQMVPHVEVGLLNPNGPMHEFRSLARLEQELQGQQIVVFDLSSFLYRVLTSHHS